MTAGENLAETSGPDAMQQRVPVTSAAPLPLGSTGTARDYHLYRWLVMCGLALTVGCSLRMWQLATKPGWQVDEVTYASLSRNLLLHGTLNLPIAYSQPWSPFLFQPPFYPLILARWFALVGVGMYQARIFAVMMSMIALTMIVWLMWKAYGPQAAAACALFLATDGWLLYVQRTSYIENTLLVPVVGVFMAYRHALEKSSARWFAATGLLAGCASIFKHTGVYVILALALGWILQRREHKLHAVAIGIAVLILAGYVLTMVKLYDYGGHDWYIGQTLVQVERAFGLVKTKGSLTSLAEFMHLAAQQYAVFLPSLLAAFGGICLLAIRLAVCVRRRDLRLLQQDVVLVCWLAAGTITFGGSALRYAQYFELVLIPAYCYLWCSAVRWARGRNLSRCIAAAACAVVVAGGLFTYVSRIAARHDNVFEQVRNYADQHIPRSSVVVAESSIAFEIPQPYCSPYGKELTPICQNSASYIITWQTFLQSRNPFGSKPLARMLSRSKPIARFTGFNGTVIIWKVR